MRSEKYVLCAISRWACRTDLCGAPLPYKGQWYLQQLQNGVFLCIQGTECVDKTFLQQDGVCPHTLNGVLCSMVALSFQMDLQRASGLVAQLTVFPRHKCL